MNPIITFFRDTLDGTTYVIVCSVSAVLLCACIGYLAEKKSKNKNQNIEENNNPVTNNTPVEQTVSMNQQATPEALENLQEQTMTETTYAIPTQENLTGIDTQATQQVQTNNINEVSLQQSQEIQNQMQPTPTGEIFPPIENQIPQQTQTFEQNSVAPAAQPEQMQSAMQAPQQVSQTPQYQQPQPMQQQPTEQVLNQQTYQQPASSGEIFPPVENQIPTAQIDTMPPTMEAATLESPQIPENVEEVPNSTQPIETIENTESLPETTPPIEQPQMPQQDPAPQIPTIQ